MAVIAISRNYKGVTCPNCSTKIEDTRFFLRKLDDRHVALETDCPLCKKRYFKQYHSCNTYEIKEEEK